MKYRNTPKKEHANERRKEADWEKETKRKEVEEDKKNSETAEEEEKYKQSYNDTASLQADGPNKEISNHLIDMIPREDMDVYALLGTEQKGEEVLTPQRKKKKKYKRKDKKDRRGEKAEVDSILRPGWFGKAVGGDKRQIHMTPNLQHFHVHYRVYVDASITLEADDNHMESTQTIGNLIFNKKKVDEHFVINSCKEGGKNLSEMTYVPTNMTELGGNIQVSGNSRIFEMRKPPKKDTNQGDSD